MTASQGIDGKYLIIGDKTALPQRCVRTNNPIGESEYTAWNLPLISNVSMVFMILVPFFLITHSSSSRFRCRFKAGLSREYRIRAKLTKLLGSILVLASLVAPPATMLTDDIDYVVTAIVIFPLLFWGGLAMIILFSATFRVTRAEDGKFWIKGCSQDFLDSLHTPVGRSTESSR